LKGAKAAMLVFEKSMSVLRPNHIAQHRLENSNYTARRPLHQLEILPFFSVTTVELDYNVCPAKQLRQQYCIF
jgi:hypothetical protein